VQIGSGLKETQNITQGFILCAHRTHKHTHTHIYIYVCVFVCLCVHSVCTQNTQTHKHTYIYIYMCVCVCVFILCAHRTQTHTHTHTVHFTPVIKISVYATHRLYIHIFCDINKLLTVNPNIILLGYNNTSLLLTYVLHGADSFLRS